MMQFPRTHFVASAAMPDERTIFRADGTRIVVGPLGVVTYDIHGNATFTGHGTESYAPRTSHTRWDLAA